MAAGQQLAAGGHSEGPRSARMLLFVSSAGTQGGLRYIKFCYPGVGKPAVQYRGGSGCLHADGTVGKLQFLPGLCARVSLQLSAAQPYIVLWPAITLRYTNDAM
jgi:hypothetical protein